jgi:hypothetical protein
MPVQSTPAQQLQAPKANTRSIFSLMHFILIKAERGNVKQEWVKDFSF